MKRAILASYSKRIAILDLTKNSMIDSYQLCYEGKAKKKNQQQLLITDLAMIQQFTLLPFHRKKHPIFFYARTKGKYLVF